MSDEKKSTRYVGDYRKDPESNAHVHVKQDVDGIAIVNSKAPIDVTNMQTYKNGWEVGKFFDRENRAKYVEGVNGSRLGKVITTDEKIVAEYIEKAKEIEERHNEIRERYDKDWDIADDD